MIINRQLSLPDSHPLSQGDLLATVAVTGIYLASYTTGVFFLIILLDSYIPVDRTESADLEVRFG